MANIQFDGAALAWREVDDDIVAVDLRRSEYLTVNAVGKVLWLRLATGADESSLTDLLVRETGIDRAQALADVASFLQSLRSRSLLLES